MKRIILAILTMFLAGCAVTGVGRYYQPSASSEKFFINAKVDGRTLKSAVMIDGQDVVTHTFPPFINSTKTKTVRYKGHEVSATFKMIKSIGTSTVVIVVFVDGEMAADFTF